MSDDLKTNYTKLNKKYQELQKQLKDAENLAYELQTKLNLKEYEPVFCNLAGRDCTHLGEVEVFKQQLSLKKMGESWEKEKKIKAFEEVSKLKEQLAEKEKKIAEVNKFIALFDCANLEEFKTFIGSCMLTPYEKEMSIIQLKKQLHTQPREIARETIEILKEFSAKTYEHASDNSEHIIAWLFTPVDMKKTLEYLDNKEISNERN